MARVDHVDTDSDAGNISTKSKKKGTKDKKSPEVDENIMGDEAKKDSGDEGPEDEEEAEQEEEEYEIEEILDAKKGTFPGGRLGYLVKWKGYDSSHNSWVDERDAGNATLLIDAFWKKSKKDKGARKSLDPKHKVSKAGRKSLDGSDVGSTSAKKRGRPKLKPEKEDSDAEDSDHAPKKKPRKSNGADTKSAKKAGAGKKASEPVNEGQEEQTPVGNMDDYMKIPSWEHLVASIDTVERTTEMELAVYFKLTNGESVREDARICALKFPQKLIAFYESNLRWKLSDS